MICNLVLWLRVYLQPPCQGKHQNRTTQFRAAKSRLRRLLGQCTPTVMLHARSAVLIWVMLLLNSPARAGVLGREVPDAASAMQAAMTIQDWVRASAVEGDGLEVDGAAVLLRLDRKLVGQGEAFSDPAKNLQLATQRALLRAMSARGEPGVPGEGFGRAIAIEIELAGGLIPLIAADDLELALGVSPGLDGVAVRLGERIAARFPSQMRPTGQNAAEVVRGLVSELAGDSTRGFDELTALREAGYAFYRFRTVNLVQLAPGTGFVFAHRGGRIVERSEIDAGRLGQMAEGIANHLCDRLWPGIEPYGLMGTLDPVTGRVESRTESPAGQAIAASALARCSQTEGLDQAVRDRARTTAVAILDQLALVAEQEIEPWSNPADGAATIIALTELSDLPDSPERDTMFDRCAARVIAAYDPVPAVFADEVPRSAWGLMALAMVRLAANEACSHATALSAVRASFRNTPPEQLVSQMPWLGWAEQEIHRGADALPSAPALIEMRRLVFDHQLDPTTLDADDRDLAGGVVFTSGTTPLPTWNAIRPMPFLADMLADERLTSGSLTQGEATACLADLLDLTRFLHQLCADPVAGHMYRRAGRSMWGVRMALWDQRISIEASSLGLESVCRLLDAVHAVADRGRGTDKAESVPGNDDIEP